MMKFLYALRFLTILPIPWKEGEDLSQVAKSVTLFPVVGLLLGLLLGTAGLLASALWPAAAAGVVVTVVWVVATGGLHLDGLSDVADGIGGGRDPERRLEIMKDSRIGAFGALALIIMFVLKSVMIGDLLAGAPGVTIASSGKTAGLLESVRHYFFPGTFASCWDFSRTPLSPAWLLLAPVSGRLVMVFLIEIFPSARTEGLGAFFKAHIGWREPAAAAVLALGIAALAGGSAGITALAGAVLLALGIGAGLSRSLGGLTGDTYGAVCEITEVAVIMAGTLLT